MEFFKDNYIHIREKSLIPFISEVPEISKIQYWDLKSHLANDIKSVKKLSQNKFLITYESKKIFKALLYDTEKFYTKTIIQYCDLYKTWKSTSSQWSIVTQYYFYFFALTTLLRFLHRGFTYFVGSNLTTLNKNLNIYSSEVIKFTDGSFYFRVVNVNQDFVDLELKYCGDSIHKLQWNETNLLLKEFDLESSGQENFIIKLLLDVAKSYKSQFPSNVRNLINYNSEYALLALENKLLYSSIVDDSRIYVRSLISFNGSHDDINQKVKYLNIYGFYFFSMLQKLYDDFILRSSSNEFNDLRKKFLKSKKIKISSLDNY